VFEHSITGRVTDAAEVSLRAGAWRSGRVRIPALHMGDSL